MTSVFAINSINPGSCHVNLFFMIYGQQSFSQPTHHLHSPATALTRSHAGVARNSKIHKRAEDTYGIKELNNPPFFCQLLFIVLWFIMLIWPCQCWELYVSLSIILPSAISSSPKRRMGFMDIEITCLQQFHNIHNGVNISILFCNSPNRSQKSQIF